jgi:hypothetical protein
MEPLTQQILFTNALNFAHAKLTDEQYNLLDLTKAKYFYLGETAILQIKDAVINVLVQAFVYSDKKEQVIIFNGTACYFMI